MSDVIDHGITVTELAAMDLPLEVAPETTTAFVGRALRGPLNTPVRIENFAAFQRRFGGMWHHSSLGLAVKQYFEHGGNTLYVVRVANNARGAMIALPSVGGVLVLHAIEPGSTETIRAAVDYDGVESSDEQTFNLVVQRVMPGTGLVVDQEIFNRVSSDEQSRSFVGTTLLKSTLVRPHLPLPIGRPLETVSDLGGYHPSYVRHAQHGTDGAELTDYDLIGSDKRDTGIFALNKLEHFDLLYLPPQANHREPGPVAILAADQYCRRRGAMMIMDPPLAWDSVDKAVDGIRNSGYSSPNIIAYFPRVATRGDNDITSREAGAAIAGLLCKLDRKQGAWEDLDQPGFGINRDLIPVVDVTMDDAQLLVREGINVIAGKAAGRAAICGSVTLGKRGQLDQKSSSLTVRRLCLKMTNAIGRGTRWAVFEPDGAHVSERILGQVDGYMSYLANAGAFADDRFVVQCEIESQRGVRDSDRGITVSIVFRPAGTSEDIALTVHQMVSGCRVAATAFAPVAAAVA